MIIKSVLMINMRLSLLILEKLLAISTLPFRICSGLCCLSACFKYFLVVSTCRTRSKVQYCRIYTLNYISIMYMVYFLANHNPYTLYTCGVYCDISQYRGLVRTREMSKSYSCIHVVNSADSSPFAGLSY